MLEIQCVQTAGELQALGPLWNPLLQASRNHSVFLSWEFISTWWHHYGGEHKLNILAAREAGQLVGIAPLMIGRGDKPHTRAFRLLTFIGQKKEIFPEYQEVFTLPGWEEEVARAMAKHLCRGRPNSWDVLLLRNVRQDSENMAILRRAILSEGLKVSMAREMPSHLVDLSAFTSLPREERWGAYLKTRSKRFRKNVRGYGRRLARQWDVNFSVVTTEEGIRDALDQLFRMQWNRWPDVRVTLAKQQYRHFHRALCQRLLHNEELLLAELALDGETVAVEYSFIHAGTVWGYQMSWSQQEALARASLGNVLNGLVLRWCLEHGLQQYDFMSGWDSEYKRRWSNDVRQVVDLEAYRPTLGGYVYKLGCRSKNFHRRSTSTGKWKILREHRRKLGL